MTNELDVAFTAAYQDPAVRVVILRGEGKNFSSGHDLGTAEQNADSNWQALSSTGFRGEYEKWSTLDADYVLKWRSLGKPVIGVLKGCGIGTDTDGKSQLWPCSNIYIVFRVFRLRVPRLFPRGNLRHRDRRR